MNPRGCPPAFCPFMSLLRKIPPAGLAVRPFGALGLAAVAPYPPRKRANMPSVFTVVSRVFSSV